MTVCERCGRPCSRRFDGGAGRLVWLCGECIAKAVADLARRERRAAYPRAGVSRYGAPLALELVLEDADQLAVLVDLVREARGLDGETAELRDRLLAQLGAAYDDATYEEPAPSRSPYAPMSRRRCEGQPLSPNPLSIAMERGS